MPRETKKRVESVAAPLAANLQNSVDTICFKPHALAQAAEEGKPLYLCLIGCMLCAPHSKDELRKCYNESIHPIILKMFSKKSRYFKYADYDIDEVWSARKQIVWNENGEDFDWWRFTHNYYFMYEVGNMRYAVPGSERWTIAQKQQWYIWDRHWFFCAHKEEGAAYTMPDLQFMAIQEEFNPQKPRPVFFYRKKFEFVDGSCYEKLRQDVAALPLGWEVIYPEEWGNAETKWVKGLPTDRRKENEN